MPNQMAPDLCAECDRPANHVPMYRGAAMRFHAGHPRREPEWMRRKRVQGLPAKDMTTFA